MQHRKKHIEELNRLTPEAFRRARKTPVAVVLDNVRSLHNVGSVFRTADAFRLAEIRLCGITACPPSAEIHKTALGAEDAVSWVYHQDTIEAVRQLQAAGYAVLALEQAADSVSLETWCPQPGQPYALVLGNEVKGVRQDVIDACDGCLEIPQFGTKHSLNVSVSAGIAIWEATRRIISSESAL